MKPTNLLLQGTKMLRSQNSTSTTIDRDGCNFSKSSEIIGRPPSSPSDARYSMFMCLPETATLQVLHLVPRRRRRHGARQNRRTLRASAVRQFSRKDAVTRKGGVRKVRRGKKEQNSGVVRSGEEMRSNLWHGDRRGGGGMSVKRLNT